MQAAILCYLTNQFEGKKEIEELENVFRAMDDDNNGELSRDEIRKGYLKEYGEGPMLEEEVDKIIEAADMNHDGTIQFVGISLLLIYLRQ
jgi:Ca2+-binding EF-hand superfamily protein